MELTTRSLRPAALTAAFGLFATLAISTGSASAIEAGSLTVTGPTTGVVGSPTVLTATGHVPSDASLARYVYVYAIPASVASTCPTSRTGALQLSDATDAMGGESVAFIAVEGDFSVPVAYVPEAAGSFILCGYLSEMVYDDAYAQHNMTVSGGTTPQPLPAGQAPQNLSRPGLSQKGGKMVCSRGGWQGADSYRFGWKVGRKSLSSSKSKLKVTKSVRGKKVRCSVTAKNAYGSAKAFSAARKAR